MASIFNSQQYYGGENVKCEKNISENRIYNCYSPALFCTSAHVPTLVSYKIGNVRQQMRACSTGHVHTNRALKARSPNFRFASTTYAAMPSARMTGDCERDWYLMATHEPFLLFVLTVLLHNKSFQHCKHCNGYHCGSILMGLIITVLAKKPKRFVRETNCQFQVLEVPEQQCVTCLFMLPTHARCHTCDASAGADKKKKQ